MDDCIYGEETRANATEELKACLHKIYSTPKEFPFSGEDPGESFSEDGLSLLVVCICRFPKGDFWKLNKGIVTFAMKVRGRKLTNENEIAEELSSGVC